MLGNREIQVVYRLYLNRCVYTCCSNVTNHLVILDNDEVSKKLVIELTRRNPVESPPLRCFVLETCHSNPGIPWGFYNFAELLQTNDDGYPGYTFYDTYCYGCVLEDFHRFITSNYRRAPPVHIAIESGGLKPLQQTTEVISCRDMVETLDAVKKVCDVEEIDHGIYAEFQSSLSSIFDLILVEKRIFWKVRNRCKYELTTSSEPVPALAMHYFLEAQEELLQQNPIFRGVFKV